MNYRQITNPVTNRKVSIDSKLGRKILKQYRLQYLSGGTSMKDDNCAWQCDWCGEYKKIQILQY